MLLWMGSLLAVSLLHLQVLQYLLQLHKFLHPPASIAPTSQVSPPTLSVLNMNSQCHSKLSSSVLLAVQLSWHSLCSWFYLLCVSYSDRGIMTKTKWMVMVCYIFTSMFFTTLYIFREKNNQSAQPQYGEKTTFPSRTAPSWRISESIL